jgi:hypothetical protein
MALGKEDYYNKDNEFSRDNKNTMILFHGNETG